jgi:alpha,alpha-trehalose phosphorylase
MRLPLLSYGRGVPAAVHRLVVASGGHHRGLLRVLAAVLSAGDAFSPEAKARNFEYYEYLTVRDSSLSAFVQAVVAAEVGHLDLAYDYFGEAALLDPGNLHHNTRDGVHLASLAGAWIAAVAGFGGMRDHGGSLSSAPQLPQQLSRLAFRLCFRGAPYPGRGRPPAGSLHLAPRRFA